MKVHSCLPCIQHPMQSKDLRHMPKVVNAISIRMISRFNNLIQLRSIVSQFTTFLALNGMSDGSLQKKIFCILHYPLMLVLHNITSLDSLGTVVRATQYVLILTQHTYPEITQVLVSAQAVLRIVLHHRTISTYNPVICDMLLLLKLSRFRITQAVRSIQPLWWDLLCVCKFKSLFPDQSL